MSLKSIRVDLTSPADGGTRDMNSIDSAIAWMIARIDLRNGAGNEITLRHHG